jgi:hypothetical protein
MNYSRAEYAKKFQTKRWQKKRAKILKRDNFKCQMDLCCSDSDDGMLHVHHIVYMKDRDPWDYDDRLLITLCSECHKRIHAINIKDMLVEHIIIYGADEALIEFLRAPVIDRVLEMWNCDHRSIMEWYKGQLELVKYVKKNFKVKK